VINDEELFRFAYAAGQSAFGDNCATCHGAGAQGFPGYPNLNDDVWLWGGSIEEIKHTITVGVRSSHADTRGGGMTAFGRDDILDRRQIYDAANYVLEISGQDYEADAAARGAEIFANECAVCHGEDGRGDRTQGAPDLTDQEWLFAPDLETIRTTITNGRMSEMPTWEGRLDPAMIDALAVYVHSLGGGEPS
jgi:cytochrome c oxidase cbb3-type subunit 3